MTARINTMLDFNIWSWNSRVFPGIDHLVAGLNERVRVRMGNLTMTNHPIHIHGLKNEVFVITQFSRHAPYVQWTVLDGSKSDFFVVTQFL